MLLQDLVDEDGSIKRIIDLNSGAGIAWQKVQHSHTIRRKTDLNVGQVHAVYPTISQEQLIKMTVNQIIGYDARELFSFFISCY